MQRLRAMASSRNMIRAMLAAGLLVGVISGALFASELEAQINLYVCLISLPEIVPFWAWRLTPYALALGASETLFTVLPAPPSPAVWGMFSAAALVVLVEIGAYLRVTAPENSTAVLIYIFICGVQLQALLLGSLGGWSLRKGLGLFFSKMRP